MPMSAATSTSSNGPQPNTDPMPRPSRRGIVMSGQSRPHTVQDLHHWTVAGVTSARIIFALTSVRILCVAM